MKADFCGYGQTAVDAESGKRLTATCGIEPGSIDVGRNDAGELCSFVLVSDLAERDVQVADQRFPHAQIPNVQASATPRLFVPPVTLVSRELIPTAETVKPIGTLEAALKKWGHRAHELVTHRRRKRVMMAAGVGMAVVVLALALIPPRDSAKPSAVPGVTTTAPNVGSTTHVQPDVADPQSASIELALTGAIAGLGNMQGVSRSAIKATVTSRAGDIVLMEISVTKPSGLTAFATVLLQKVGSQWRMRQIVDERN